MGKRIYLISLVVVSILGVGVMVYFGNQPRPLTRIGIAKIASQASFSESIQKNLQSELTQPFLLVIGFEIGNQIHQEFLKSFFQNQENPVWKFDFIYRHSELPEFENLETISLNIKEQFTNFIEQAERQISDQKRIAVIVPTSFSSQIIENNAAHFIQGNIPIKVLSLSLVDFPRNREDEKSMSFPCVVEGVDQSGLGPFGCQVVQNARALYPQKFTPGDIIGSLHQMGPQDFLVLLTQEK